MTRNAFALGVPVRDRKLLDTVMVRRLKQDLREIGEEFPERQITPVVINNLLEDAPDLKLSHLVRVVLVI